MENKMVPDLWILYRNMLKSRLFEEAVIRLWQEGRISGEMHLGMGEEAIVAGILDHLIDGDAMALDHRGTPPLIMRGVDPVSLLREFMGFEDGLCRGKGGHMHLFSRSALAASSGIVGASGPAAAGFGLAAQLLRPGTVAVAFFGEGAMNQGMLLESMNLASVWKLPVIFVCKDNSWSITTPSPSVTGGNLDHRAESFGLHTITVDGLDTEAVWIAGKEGVERGRNGTGPSFIHASCTHLEGHFLGDPLLNTVRHPLSGVKEMAAPVIKAFTRKKGAAIKTRTKSLSSLMSLIGKTFQESHSRQRDPVHILRKKLEKDLHRLQTLEEEVKTELQLTLTHSLKTEEVN
jgi:TPP-dependent pyruvate/acetoin dehydrogenase alpha subunit